MTNQCYTHIHIHTHKRIQDSQVHFSVSVFPYVRTLQSAHVDIARSSFIEYLHRLSCIWLEKDGFSHILNVAGTVRGGTLCFARRSKSIRDEKSRTFTFVWLLILKCCDATRNIDCDKMYICILLCGAPYRSSINGYPLGTCNFYVLRT